MKPVTSINDNKEVRLLINAIYVRALGLNGVNSSQNWRPCAFKTFLDWGVVEL